MFEIPLFGLQLFANDSVGWYSTDAGNHINEYRDGKVEIGNLLPSKQVELLLWSNLEADQDKARYTQFTYKDGFTKVEYPEKFYGAKAKIASNINFQNFLVFILLVFFALICLVILLQERMKKKSSKVNSDI